MTLKESQNGTPKPVMILFANGSYIALFSQHNKPIRVDIDASQAIEYSKLGVPVIKV